VAYFTYNQKYLYNAFLEGCSADGAGNLYLRHWDYNEGALVVLNEHYQLIRKIKVDAFKKETVRPNGETRIRYGTARTLAVRDNKLVMMLDRNEVLVLDLNGALLHKMILHDAAHQPRHFLQNNGLRMELRRHIDGRELLLVPSAFRGTQLAIGTEVGSDFSRPDIFPTRYLTSTEHFTAEYQLPLQNSSPKNGANTLFQAVEKLREEYRNDPDPKKPFLDFTGPLRIWDVASLGADHVVAFVYTNMANKSNSPNKNMPYFLVKIDVNTGGIVKIISPDDRSIVVLNIIPRFFVNMGRVIFKTCTAVYEIGEDLNLKSLYDIPARALYGGLFPYAYDDKMVHYAHAKQKAYYGYRNDLPVEETITQMQKELRKDKKAFNGIETIGEV